MATKDKPNKPAVDLVEDIPEGLRGPEDDRPEGGFVPATRSGMALMSPEDMQNYDMEGVRAPFLSLVTGTSTELLAKEFNQGDLVLAKEFRVAAKGTRLPAVILNIAQYKKQRLTAEQWTEGIKPRTFKDYAEAEAAGFKVKWDDAKGLKPEVGPAMDLLLLIRRGEGVNGSLFGVDIGIEDGGKPTEWAICMLSVDKTCYKALWNDLANTLRFKLARTGSYSALFELSTEMSAPSKNSPHRPFVIRARFAGMLDPRVVGNIKGVMSVPVSAADKDEVAPE